MELRQRSKKRESISSHKIQFRANADGLRSLDPCGLKSFTFDVCCSQCSTIQKDVVISEDKFEISELCEFVNYNDECQKCNNMMRIEINKNLIHSTTGVTGEWEPLLYIDCRGCRIDIVRCHEWVITTKSNKKIEWNGKDEYFDFDDDISATIGVTEIEYYIQSLA